MELIDIIFEEIGLIHLWVRRRAHFNTYSSSSSIETSSIKVSLKSAELISKKVFKKNNISKLDTSLLCADSSETAVYKLDWDILKSRVVDCMRCHLCKRRTNTVFGIGNKKADWMLIGEAPGESEDLQGEPFVGRSGKLLDNMLQSLSLKRSENVYITNVIKCRPPKNRNPEPNEVASCMPYLRQQIVLVKPKLIVALGRFAGQTLLHSTLSIASMRGRVYEYDGIPVVVTYHPAYLLRSPFEKSKAWIDFCLARDIFFGKSRHNREIRSI
ncbi:MAG: uracil-DNA glycosylase [Burkholderia sp.]|nr:uracil-DNA glycosylase [Burkholderia sp.]